MRYTHYKGLTQVQNWVKLKFAAMNIKKFAKRKWNDLHRSSHLDCISDIFIFLFNNFKTPALNSMPWQVFFDRLKGLRKVLSLSIKSIERNI